jgi:NAD-dependent deacetylase
VTGAAAPDLPEALLGILERARRPVVLTGAGMSAECGVPVFRGPGGLWEGIRPEELATPEAFARDPARVWRWYRWRLERVAAARPHAGHTALAALEREEAFDGFTVITQNVDGMHQRAGSRDVIELHGSLVRARCTALCGFETGADGVDPEDFSCPCGKGRLRPGVVWFGESLPARALRRAAEVLAGADLVWVVGTSSVVHPAAALPELAAARGAAVVEVNPEPTPLTARVPFSLRCTASAGITAMTEARRKRRRQSF